MKSAKRARTTAWLLIPVLRNAVAIKTFTELSRIRNPCRALVSFFFLKSEKYVGTYIYFCISKEPPSKPQNLTVNFVDQSTVVLSWNQPHNLGGRTDTVYRVVCDACNVGVTYNPPQVFNLITILLVIYLIKFFIII